MAGVTSECDGDCAIPAPGRYDIHTLHTSGSCRISWRCRTSIFTLAPMPRGSIPRQRKSGNPDERYGARVRLNISSDRAVWRTLRGVRRGEFRTGRLAHRAAQECAVGLALEVLGRFFHRLFTVVDVLQGGAELGDDLRIVEVRGDQAAVGGDCASFRPDTAGSSALITPSSVR